MKIHNKNNKVYALVSKQTDRLDRRISSNDFLLDLYDKFMPPDTEMEAANEIYFSISAYFDDEDL